MNKEKGCLGQALRTSAFENDFVKVMSLLENGADINYEGGEYSTKSVALNEAIRNQNYEMIHYLLKNSASTNVADRYGYKAYNEACKTKNKKIIELIKENNNSEQHNKEYCINLLKQYNVPEEVIEYLDMERKDINLENSKWTKRIEVSALDEIRIFNHKGVTYVDFIAEVENYSNIGVISWIPEKNTFGCFDYETELEGTFEYMTWNEFLENPSFYIDKSLGGEYK